MGGWAHGFQTTQTYIARGQTERHRIRAPLPPLPAGFFNAPKAPLSLGLVPDLSQTKRSKIMQLLAKVVTPTGIEVEQEQPDRQDTAPIIANDARPIGDVGDRKCPIDGALGRIGTLADDEDSASGIALAEEGEQRALALAEEMARAIRAGDLELARELATRLSELLDGVQAAFASA